MNFMINTFMELRVVVIVFVTLFTSCSKENEVVNSGSNLKLFKVKGVRAKYDLEFSFPNSYLAVKDLSQSKQIDTSDALLRELLGIQYSNPDLYCVFDSLDKSLNIIIKAGPRVDISSKSRDMSYFSVPTIPLYKVFPKENDNMKIVYDSGKKSFKNRTYYKRTYKYESEKSIMQDFYYISSKWQSVLVIVKSNKEIDLSKYILSYEIIPKK